MNNLRSFVDNNKCGLPGFHRRRIEFEMATQIMGPRYEFMNSLATSFWRDCIGFDDLIVLVFFSRIMFRLTGKRSILMYSPPVYNRILI